MENLEKRTLWRNVREAVEEVIVPGRMAQNYLNNPNKPLLNRAEKLSLYASSIFVPAVFWTSAAHLTGAIDLAVDVAHKYFN